MDTGTVWHSRIKTANKYFEKWSSTYKTDMLMKYRRGLQWPEWTREGEKPYTLNMVYSTIEIKLASYSFADIQFVVSAKPEKMDYNIDLAARSSNAKNTVLNTLVQAQKAAFQDEIEAALVDSFFRFGLVEVGFSADYIINPNAGKPLFASDIDPQADSDDLLREPEAIPQNEVVFFKRLNPKRFRIGGIEGRYLHQCNWFGYYDFYYKDDIRANKNLKNTDKIETQTHRTEEYEAEMTSYSDEHRTAFRNGDLLKVWKIWDTRAKHLILWDEANDAILYEAPYKRISIFDLRWCPDDEGWYPIPPVFQWVSPQNEINEARQQMRSFRRRFVDQYQAVEGTIAEEEKEKFEDARDGAIITVKRDEALRPIQKPSLSQVVPETMVVGKDDFILVSGISSDSMGVGDRITATQSIEISKRFMVRENREQIKVARWLSKIGREGLALVTENFSLGLWVKAIIDGGETLFSELQETQNIWQYISSQDLDDGVDYDVDVLITSMSPVANEEEKRKFLEFLATVTRFPQIALSPKLIREAAYRIGYRNESVIKEMQTMALIAMFGAMQQPDVLGGGSPDGDKAAQQKVAQMSPNTQEQIDNQLEGQM